MFLSKTLVCIFYSFLYIALAQPPILKKLVRDLEAVAEEFKVRYRCLEIFLEKRQDHTCSNRKGMLRGITLAQGPMPQYLKDLFDSRLFRTRKRSKRKSVITIIIDFLSLTSLFSISKIT